MSYVAPSPDDFKTRFPIFNTMDDPTIQRFLTEAGNHIDDTWDEDDYPLAIMYLAAHLIATDNSTAGTAPDVGGIKGPLTSESFSGMSRSYGSGGANSQTGVGASQYATTEYGRRYWDMLQKNQPPIMVI